MVQDNASAPTIAALLAFAKRDQDRLEWVFLPTYSPHLFLIERLWHLMRSQITRNRFFPSLHVLEQAVTDWLAPLPFAKSCSILGVAENHLVSLH